MKLKEFWRKLKDMNDGERYIVIDEDGDPQFVITPFTQEREDAFDFDDDVWNSDEDEDEDEDESADIRAGEGDGAVRTRDDAMERWDAMMEEVGPYGAPLNKDSTQSALSEQEQEEPIFQFEPVDDERV